MIFKICLYLHIIAGIMGLVIGPVSMFSKKTRGLHTQSGIIYFWLMILVCFSAIALAIIHWEKSWWFLFVAIFSFSFALKGYRAVINRGTDWLKKHITGMLGSYIAMTTALLVVNASNIPGHEKIPAVIFWLLPTIIGTPVIKRLVAK